jgi:site-specific DNA recombinase
MSTSQKKLARCAIYTRKSTEHNLDLEFNSLDAQREACEAYIKSQAHEGWRLIHDHYDDGAFSGASLDRPALQKLLADIRSGKIDIVVVYKVDRLTRSLADFAKLVELFDQHAVSFVSVTQSFNTTSSMGRLTLNVLLSFAQFEREVIGERVRDKIAASKRKGIWVGGPIPLGYASINKKLVVVPEEAETVRTIFKGYLELGSVGALVRDLDIRGIRTKRRVGAKARASGGIRFGVGSLAHLLKNRFYVGEVVYRGEVCRGEHEPVVDQEIFQAAQAKLSANAVNRQLRLKGFPAILAGRIFDDRGNRMTPTHTTKRGARYRYYISHALIQKRKDASGAVARVPAAELESLVVKALCEHLKATGMATSSITADGRDLVDLCLERVTVGRESVELRLFDTQNEPKDSTAPDTIDIPDQNIVSPMTISLRWTAPNFAAVKGILHNPSQGLTITSETKNILLATIAKSRAWMSDLIDGTASFAEIAKRERKVERHIRLLAPLAFVSPRIVSAIIDGSAPVGLTVTGLAKSSSHSWTEQERRIGMPNA